MKKRFLFTFAMLGLSSMLFSQTWIWYPGDYELWLGNRMNNRRTERGAFFPPFWKTDSHYVVVEFSKAVELEKPEVIHLAVEGKYNVKIDGKLQFGMPETIRLEAGRHQLNIKVWNQVSPPALFVNGETVKSDSSWKVTFEDKEWIDESGKASDTSATLYESAGSWNFDSEDSRPSQFTLPRELKQPAGCEKRGNGMLYDFGKETFGYLVLNGISGEGRIGIYYGESPEEALDKDACETLDFLRVEADKVVDLSTSSEQPKGASYTMENSKAFRYVYVEAEAGVEPGNATMQFEYLPVEQRGTFRCNDEELNRIWEIGAYTMFLTTREFFIDGIKRDRWVWSGDAIQSYLMNYYLFFEQDAVERTIWLLRGKDPVTSHVNTIMDYTFYWFLSIYDYYMYVGDKQFVRQIYPRMKSLMEFVLGRTNEEGMVEGLAGDWVFVDWADGYLDKKGELAFEQVLFCKSLETMSLCARLAEDDEAATIYEALAADLRSKLNPCFWNEQKQALVHNRVDGRPSETVTRYANIFALLYGYFDEKQGEQIKNSVLLNDEILGITTPYMRFYELEALCYLGEQERVMKEMKSYWGGMLRENATTFWEKYNPQQQGTEHLAMYNRPYGKSLCHAWGASPIYLLGKYFLGVTPAAPGYEEFTVRPCLGGLKWMEGTVPMADGEIRVYMDKKKIRVEATKGRGYVYFDSRRKPKANIGTIEKLSDGSYRLPVSAGEKVEIQY